MKAIESQANDPKRAGQHAGNWEVFGENSRYKVYPIHTRFAAVTWFVTDAEKPEADGVTPSVIRQAETQAEAVVGLV